MAPPGQVSRGFVRLLHFPCIVVNSARSHPQRHGSLKKLAARFHASIDRHAFDQFSSMQKIETEWDAAGIKETLGLKRKPTSPFFKEAGNNARIYPGYFAPVIVWGNGMRQIRPMRYRVRPHGSAEEIPARFYVFNARLDSLETRRTWKGLFMRKHAFATSRLNEIRSDL